MNCLVGVLLKHPDWISLASLVSRTISVLACGSRSGKIVTLLRKAGCCSALVQAVCVHHRAGEEVADQGLESVSTSSPLMLLRDLLQCICDLVDADHLDPNELLRGRALFLREGAHEAVVLVARMHKVSVTSKNQASTGANKI